MTEQAPYIYDGQRPAAVIYGELCGKKQSGDRLCSFHMLKWDNPKRKREQLHGRCNLQES